MGVKFDSGQYKALEKLESGKILIGGVGSGKSRTALAYYYIRVCGGLFPFNDSSMYRPMQRKIPLYIITTAKKRDAFEWMDECGSLGIGNDITTIDSWQNIQKYCNVCGAFFIFDEQRLVGNGAWVKAFYQIAKKNKWIVLTATPGDTWMDYIPIFIANGFYKNRTQFIKRHVVYVRNPYIRYPKVDYYVETDRLRYLKNLLSVYIEYTSEHERHDEFIKCDYDKELYSLVIEKRWDPFEEHPIKNISGVCYLLRKVVNSSMNRINVTKNYISKFSRLIIFYNFDYELDILRQIAKEMNVYCAEWNGHKHMPLPKEDEWLYLVQYNSGAEGWNCTRTNAVLFYSQTYSYKQLEQAKGRIDRRDTEYTDLYYIHLLSNSSIDSAIRKTLSKKEDFNESTFMTSR